MGPEAGMHPAPWPFSVVITGTSSKITLFLAFFLCVFGFPYLKIDLTNQNSLRTKIQGGDTVKKTKTQADRPYRERLGFAGGLQELWKI